MCGSGQTKAANVELDKQIEAQRRANALRSARTEKVALELRRPEGESQIRTTAALLGVQQLRAGLLNVPK